VSPTRLSFVPAWNGVQLRTLTGNLLHLPSPRVLLGDLNMPPPFPRVLSRWRSLANVATHPAWDPRIQLDHVLASGELPPVVAIESLELAVSDHRALLVQLVGRCRHCSPLSAPLVGGSAAPSPAASRHVALIVRTIADARRGSIA